MTKNWSTPFFRKFIELQFEWRTELAAQSEFSFRIYDRCDHAGIFLTISIFRWFFFELSLYDSRHWDYQNQRWFLAVEEYDTYHDNRMACNLTKLNDSFNWQTTHEMSDKVGHLNRLAKQTFEPYIGLHKRAAQFANEIETSIGQ